MVNQIRIIAIVNAQHKLSVVSQRLEIVHQQLQHIDKHKHLHMVAKIKIVLFSTFVCVSIWWLLFCRCGFALSTFDKKKTHMKKSFVIFIW